MRLIDAEELIRCTILNPNHTPYITRKDIDTQPEYEELTPVEAASEIGSGSIMSAKYWLEAMVRLKQMGYAICRKR